MKTIKIPPKYTIQDPWMTPTYSRCLALAQNYIGNVLGSSDLIPNTKNALNTAMSILILKMPKSKYDAKHYLHLNKIKQSKSIFITLPDTEEIRQMLGTLNCRNSSGHDELS